MRPSGRVTMDGCTRAAFNCLFPDEIAALRPGVESNYLRYLTSTEQASMPAGFDPPFHAKLGLLARARLNHDARDLEVAKVIRAKPPGDPLLPAESSPPAEPPGPLAPGLSATFPPGPPADRIVPPLLPGG